MTASSMTVSSIALSWKNSSTNVFFIGGILFLTVQSIIGAQQVSLEQIPALRERAVIMRCISRIVEQNEQVVWDSETSRVTVPGRPVGVRLIGANLVILVQFTPFLHPNGRYSLVAHGQTWINIPNEGISYHTTIQTIPLELNEPIYFFPLGSTNNDDDEARIEIQITLEPFTEPHE